MVVEIDALIGQLETEAEHLAARIPFLSPSLQGIAREALTQTRERLLHPALGVLKQALANFRHLPLQEQSRVAQLRAEWVVWAQGQLNTMRSIR